MDKGIIWTIRRKLQVLAYDLTSPEFVSKIYYKHMMGYSLNLKNPTMFNEKIQWLKLYEWPNNPLAIQCGDKYTVRSYIEDKGLGQYLNELIGVWENIDDIPWDKLPNQFALKVSNGCGENIICEDKSKLNVERAKKQLRKWVKEDFGKYNAEPHYSKMPTHLICEKYLGGNMTDYKFFCFNGKVGYMNVTSHPNGNILIAGFTADGNPTPFKRTGDAVYDENAKLPKHFGQMKELSEKIAADFPFVRVDWYEVDGKVYIGELTFTPNGGLGRIEPREYERYWGDQIDLTELMKRRKRSC